MSFSSPIVIGAVSYHEVSRGRYIHGNTTIDQPSYLVLKADPKADGVSSFLIQRQHYENSSVAGAPDNLLQVHLAIKYPALAFDQTDVSNVLGEIVTFANAANLTKLLRGEV